MRVIFTVISVFLLLWESQGLSHKLYQEVKKEALTKVYGGLPDLQANTQKMTGQKCDFKTWKCKKLTK